MSETEEDAHTDGFDNLFSKLESTKTPVLRPSGGFSYLFEWDMLCIDGPRRRPRPRIK